MSKNIIFCADGTWNGSTEEPDHAPHITNVLKVFYNLRSDFSKEVPALSENGETGPDDAKELECVYKEGDTTLQIAKYLHGVGDSDNELVKLLGGTIGAGLVGRVIRGYTFISRNYVAGDRIHLVGFSRGAYTARALAGLIAAKGLLSAKTNKLEDHEAAYKLGSSVWGAYREEALKSNLPAFGRVQAWMLSVPHLFDQVVNADQLVPDVKIKTVAVWDTVGSVGIPAFDSHGHVVEALKFVDNKLSDAVEKGFHAISLDECRESFPSCGWDRDDGRVVQVLFPGAHADVGGGYPVDESGLSDVALMWMTEQLTRQEVLFAPVPAVVPAPVPTALAHRPWDEDTWKNFPQVIRSAPDNQMAQGRLIHASVKERMEKGSIGAPGQGPVPYNPLNLKSYRDSADDSIGSAYFAT